MQVSTLIAVIFLAYFVFVFIAEAFNPLAKSNRSTQRRRERLGRRLATIVLLSPAALFLYQPSGEILQLAFILLFVSPICLFFIWRYRVNNKHRR